MSTNSTISSRYDCNICFEEAASPVVTVCGHLYCWPCLEVWLDKGARDCPVCRGFLDDSDIIPILGRGSESDDLCGRQVPRNRRINIPRRSSEYMLDLGIVSFSYSSDRLRHRTLPAGTASGINSANDARKRAVSQFLIFLGIVLIILVISS